MSEPAIEVRDLGKRYKLFRRPSDRLLDAFGIASVLPWRKVVYKPFWALRDVSLTVGKGERLGVIGRNGAGKSTLLKLIIGNITPTEGTVKVSGRVQALMEIGTGFHPEFTGRENIRASLAYQGLRSDKARLLEEEIIDFAEIDEFIDQPIKTYSAGMYARLAFSTATAIEPDILVIDEVLGAGDAYFAGKCVERMRALTESSGATVLFVSHDLNSVQALCDRVIWIDKGSIRMDGRPLDVIKQYTAMIRREDEIRLRARDLKVSKRHATVLESLQDIYHTMLFRFVGKDGGHPTGACKIRSLALYCNSREVGRISVGAPMDNSTESVSRVLDEPGYMDWGPSCKDSTGYYRLYSDLGGKYAHAPFEFYVPRAELAGEALLALVVDGEATTGDIAVEVFSPSENAYRRLGLVPAGAGVSEFAVPILPAEQGPGQVPAHVAADKPEIAGDEYGSRQARIAGVRLLDSTGADTKVLFSEEPFEVVLEYQTEGQLTNPVFVFCVYMPSGQTASQWLVQSRDLGVDTVSGRGELRFKSDALLLGCGQYVASAALFKWYPRNGVEPDAYHVLNRCVHFEVVDRPGADPVDKGICRQPFKAILRQAADGLPGGQ